MQPNIESQGFTYKTDCYKIIELFCNGETGISYALYELYKSIMIYHNGDIYVYDKNYTLWILQKNKEKVFALATLNPLYEHVYNIIISDLRYNHSLAKSVGKKDDEQAFYDKIEQLNKINRSFNYNKTKINISQGIIAYLAKSSDPNFIGFNRMPDILAIPGNKILDMTTGLTYPREPQHYFSSEIRVDYEPNADIDFEPFYKIISAMTLEDMLPLEERINLKFLQETFAYCASGCADRSLMFLFIGDGANGKSKIIRLFSEILGEDLAKPAHRDVLLAGKRNAEAAEPMLHALQNVRFAPIAEGKEGDKLDEAKIKQLTGNDQVISRTLSKEPSVNKKPITTFIYPINQLPIIKFDYAIERRILCINFPTRFTENPVSKNDRLTNKNIEQIIDSIEFKKAFLAFIIKGRIRSAAQGYFVPESVKLSTKQFRLSQNPLEAFIEEYIHVPEILSKGEWLLYSEFKNYYQRYCKSIDKKHESDKAIGTYLKSKYLFTEGGDRKYAFQFKNREKLISDFPDEIKSQFQVQQQQPTMNAILSL